MDKTAFNVSISVDETTGRIQAVYFRVRSGKVADTREIIDGKVFADYDAADRLLGVELLSPCEAGIIQNAFPEEPESIRRFLRGAVPHDMVAA